MNFGIGFNPTLMRQGIDKQYDVDPYAAIVR